MSIRTTPPQKKTYLRANTKNKMFTLPVKFLCKCYMGDNQASWKINKNLLKFINKIFIRF